jgi:hypothetical protein
LPSRRRRFSAKIGLFAAGEFLSGEKWGGFEPKSFPRNFCRKWDIIYSCHIQIPPESLAAAKFGIGARALRFAARKACQAGRAGEKMAGAFSVLGRQEA